jgi:hypothetical protein
MPWDYNTDEALPRLPLGDYFAQMFGQAPPTDIQPTAPPPQLPPDRVSGSVDFGGTVADPRMLSNPSMYGAPNAPTAVGQNTGMSALLAMPIAGGQLTAGAKLPYLAAPPPEYGQRPHQRLEPRFELGWRKSF